VHSQTVAGQNDGDSVTLQQIKHNVNSAKRTLDESDMNRRQIAIPLVRFAVDTGQVKIFHPSSVVRQKGQNEPNPAQGAA